MMQGDDFAQEQAMVMQLLRFDEAVVLGICRWRAPSLTLAMRALTRFGEASTWIVVGGVPLAGLGLLGPFHLGLALAIAISRVYLGAHYPLDVAAGGALGLVAGLLARALF
jgi:membrane-associated phospholipid phosphatase